MCFLSFTVSLEFSVLSTSIYTVFKDTRRLVTCFKCQYLHLSNLCVCVFSLLLCPAYTLCSYNNLCVGPRIIS